MNGRVYTRANERYSSAISSPRSKWSFSRPTGKAETGFQRPFEVKGRHSFTVRSWREKVWKEYREIYMLTDLGHSLSLREPIIVAIDHKASQVIVSTEFPRLFAYGPSTDEAIKSYKSLLRDYFKHLQDTTRRLAPNLQAELAYLQRVIQDHADRTSKA